MLEWERTGFIKLAKIFFQLQTAFSGRSTGWMGGSRSYSLLTSGIQRASSLLPALNVRGH